MTAPGSVRLEHVLVRGAEPGVTARLGVSALLGSVELHPRALPPSATLLFRSLRIAAPTGWSVTPGSRTPASWRRSFESEVAELARHAARPAAGRLDGDPEVVLFLDEAEILACLAAALVDHARLGAWYWRALLRATPSLAAWVARARRVPHALPACFALLDRWGRDERFITTIPEADVAPLATSVAVAFGGSSPGRGSPDPTVPDAPPRAAPFGPWTPVPTEIRAWGVERATLFGLVHLLHRHPRAAAAPSFARALDGWRARMFAVVASGGPVSTELPVASPLRSSADLLGAHVRVRSWTAEAPATSGPVHPPVARDEKTGSPEPRPRRLDPRPRPSDARPAEPTAIDAVAPSIVRAAPRPAPEVSPRSLAPTDETTSAGTTPAPTSTASPAFGPMTPVEGPDPTTSPPPPRVVPEASPELRPPVIEEATVITALGGVFYLLNLLEALAIPRCFDPPWRLGEQLGPWGVLELIARALLAEVGDRESDLDPLWALLAALDGRDPHVVSPVVGPAEVEIPDGWSFGPGPPFTSSSPWLDARPPALSRWLARVFPYVRGRLVAALDGAPLGPILRRTAEVFVTRTHVDVVERAEGASLAARRAGLDRDPGWRPDLGRVVALHFR